MGLFGKIIKGISKVASSVGRAAAVVASAAVDTALATVDAFIDAASEAVDWATEKLGEFRYDSRSVASRVGVEQALKEFRDGISEQAQEAEKHSVQAAMSHFDEFTNVLDNDFPELVELVKTRKEEAETVLTNTIIDYVQVHISENDPAFQELLEMEPGPEKKRLLEKRMASIIDDAQDYFAGRLKEQLQLLNEELNVRLEQKIRVQEKNLRNTEDKYKKLAKQQSGEKLDIQKLEEECIPVIEAAVCIQIALGGI